MKPLIYILLITSLTVSDNFFAQPTEEWVMRHPSPTSQYSQFQVSFGTTQTDAAYSIIQTSDEGFAVAGFTAAGGFNGYIVKLDASCKLQWTRTLGGTGWDIISSIVQTKDGGYIAAGSSIFKLDANGTLQWSVNISGGANSIIQTSDGGYVMVGSTNSFGAGNYDMFIVKLNSSGTLQWARTVGGTGWDYGYSIVQTLDGGYAVAGDGPNLFTVIKLDNSGTLQWARSFAGMYPNSIIQTTDGGYAVAGYTDDSSGNRPFYIVKLDSIGELLWTRTVGVRSINIANSIVQTRDGGYAVAGHTGHVETPPDWYIVKLDSAGTLQWSRIVGGGTEYHDFANSIVRTIDGGYAVAGGKDSFDPAGDMYIVKYDSAWNTCGSNDSLVSSYSGTWESIRTVTPTVTSPTGFITPRTPIVGSGGTVTTICVTGIEPITNEIPASFKLYQNYPNPFNSKSKIKYQISKIADVKLRIFDVLGREIKTLVNETLKPGIYEAEWDGENYPSGIYFYRLAAMPDGRQAGNEFVETRKLVLLK